MRNRIDRRMVMAGLVTLFCCIFFVAEVSAQDARNRGNGEMQDIVEAVDTRRGTVTIAGETFVVSDSSRLFDSRGGRIRLGELKTSRMSRVGDMVEYSIRAGRKGSQKVIRLLSIVEGDFE